MDILQAVGASTPIGLLLVELEPVAVSATPAALINEGTLSVISFANGPFDRCWNIPRRGRCIGLV